MTKSEVKGADKVDRALSAMPKKLIQGGNRGLLKAGNKWMEAAKKTFLTPASPRKQKAPPTMYRTARGNWRKTYLVHPPDPFRPTIRTTFLRGSIKLVDLKRAVLVAAGADYAVFVEKDRPYMLADLKKRRQMVRDEVGAEVAIEVKRVFD